MPGNNRDVNLNGRRFFRFLGDNDCIHINGAANVTQGLWTRQRAGVSSVIDFGVISVEHLHTVKSMMIDDQCVYPSGSDHNWLFIDLFDKFVRKIRKTNQQSRKKTWDFRDDFNWNAFAHEVQHLVGAVDYVHYDPDELAKLAAQILLDAGKKHVGFKSLKKKVSMASNSLPPEVVATIELKGILETHWKSKLSELSSMVPGDRTEAMIAHVNEAEAVYVQQKRLVSALLREKRNACRDKILKECQGNSIRALKCFWSHVSQKTKTSVDISAVTDSNGVLICDPEGIRIEVEKHLIKVFKGSLTPFLPADILTSSTLISEEQHGPSSHSDHQYAASSSPSLPPSDGSCSLQTDPQGWIDRDYNIGEIRYAVGRLENGKAKGLDLIPNEFLKNSGDEFLSLLTLLFNKIKNSGTFPAKWNQGRICLVHKRGLKDLLGNYRPLTVIVSMSGLYSRVMNLRLTQVVEEHSLIGEIQNGFRQGRRSADNAFILQTILWKQKFARKRVHMGYIDIQKAYDSINRYKLWRKLSSLGFGGKFLASLQSIYANDSVVTTVNGLETRPVFLQRGLRQGCSLSPILFNIYVSDIGNDITTSDKGFMVGSVMVNGLFFADDLVLVAGTREGLLDLLEIVYMHTVRLDLDINTGKDKSEILSQLGEACDVWELKTETGETVLSLRQVLQYRYLGTEMFSTMYKTGVNKQKICVDKAYKYKNTCFYIAKDGPDLTDMLVATWCNIAIPAILSGCETIPFSDNSINEIEKVQSQVAKYALGLPIGAANVCAQIDLGFKTFRHLLFEHQLKFYVRTICLSRNRWVKQALSDHLTMTWNSPYLNYLHKVRVELNLYELPECPIVLTNMLETHFVKVTNTKLSSLSLPWIKPVERFSRLRYTREGLASETIAQCRYDSAGIGNKFPRENHVVKQSFCPLCPTWVKNTVSHVALFCPLVEQLRRERTVMSSFRNMCHAKNITDDQMFELFISGYNWNNEPVTNGDFLSRGTDLRLILDLWLSKW